MRTKTVYQLDQDGFLVGASAADWLIDDTWQIPAGCIEKAPPIERKGYLRRWDGKKWNQVKMPAG